MSVNLLLVAHYYPFNGCRICSDIPILFPMLVICVSLSLYFCHSWERFINFIDFFEEPAFCFIDFLGCFLVLHFPFFFMPRIRSSRQKKKSLSLIYVLVSPLTFFKPLSEEVPFSFFPKPNNVFLVYLVSLLYHIQ